MIIIEIERKYGLLDFKNWNKTRHFVFNYNNSHFLQSFLPPAVGVAVGSAIGFTLGAIYNVATGKWSIEL